MHEIPRADPEARKALARDARDLSDDPAFKAGVIALRQQWFGELMDESLTDKEKIVMLVMKLRSLTALPSMLQHFVTSEVMANRSGRQV